MYRLQAERLVQVQSTDKICITTVFVNTNTSYCVRVRLLNLNSKEVQSSWGFECC